MKKNNYLYVRKEKIEIEKEKYIEFNKLVCKQKYSERCYTKHTIPLDTAADEFDLEDKAIREILIEKLNSALKQLTEEEYLLIFELFFNGRSVRGLSRDWNIHPMTIYSKKTKILEKLKKMIKT